MTVLTLFSVGRAELLLTLLTLRTGAKRLVRTERSGQVCAPAAPAAGVDASTPWGNPHHEPLLALSTGRLTLTIVVGWVLLLFVVTVNNKNIVQKLTFGNSTRDPSPPCGRLLPRYVPRARR